MFSSRNQYIKLHEVKTTAQEGGGTVSKKIEIEDIKRIPKPPDRHQLVPGVKRSHVTCLNTIHVELVTSNAPARAAPSKT